LERGKPLGKVLIVEDSKLQRLLLTAINKKLGHEVKEANNGLRGLELAKLFRPDFYAKYGRYGNAWFQMLKRVIKSGY
jgi:PleD family two-component response regulator